MDDLLNRPRLFLITPPEVPAADLLEPLKKALSGGDVACVLIYAPDLGTRELQAAGELLVPVIQKAGAAAIIYRDTQAAGRCGADGVHIDTSFDDIKQAIETFQPARIVGTNGTKSKHDDMQRGEAGVDYMLFGRLDLEEHPEVHPKTLTLADWWAELFETPCVALAGNDITSVEAAAATGADFVAAKNAVWQHPDGPEAAVRLANEILEKHPFEEAS